MRGSITKNKNVKLKDFEQLQLSGSDAAGVGTAL
jgi:hypothetical protein